MALKQRCCSVGVHRGEVNLVNTVSTSSNSKHNDVEINFQNRERLVSKEMLCCSSCWEVQHINNCILTVSNNEAPLMSPTLINRPTPISPQISPLLTQLESPVLGRRTPSFTETYKNTDESPVIGSYTTRKRARETISTDSDIPKIEAVSPDILSTQMTICTYNINSDNDCPSASQSPIKISQMTTQNSEKFDPIELIFSNDDSENDEINSVLRESPPLNYSFPDSTAIAHSTYSSTIESSCKTTKKKRYKKKGLASILQKCIKNKSCSTAIWLHEQQFNKYGTDTLPTQIMNIDDFWEEYSNFVLRCSYIFKNDTEVISGVESDSCIVILHTSLINSFVPCKNKKFCLYTPYTIKFIRYNTKLLKCFCNVSRFKMYEPEKE